ncbi:hypothetical protein GCM10010191_19800 [Actinomadura vinacea]|uniref:Uncharacterized protein n=1 Tax=Actinomadura vinacea TaxID=115336 RepID=A0ABN3IRQ7_9ACTN
MVQVWRDAADFFTPEEQAALALTEFVTRIADNVPDVAGKRTDSPRACARSCPTGSPMRCAACPACRPGGRDHSLGDAAGDVSDLPQINDLGAATT